MQNSNIEITKMAEDFIVLEENHGVRAYLFIGKTSALLVDAGFTPAMTAAAKICTDLPLHLILTHGDGDHTGGAGDFDGILMHKDEAEYSKLSDKAQKLHDGSTVSVGRFTFEVIHIPGHTPGSIALLEKTQRFLIGGDSVQTGPIYMFGAGRDMAAYKASMEKLIARRGEFDVVYSSHNELEVAPAQLDALKALAEDVLAGKLPEPAQGPEFLPKNVGVYGRGGAYFLLAR